MDSPIVPIALIQDKARADFARGIPRDGHGFNWHALAAIAVWQHEWDLCAAEAWGFTLEQQLEGACPP